MSDNYKKFYELEVKGAKLRRDLELCTSELNKVLQAIREEEKADERYKEKRIAEGRVAGERTEQVNDNKALPVDSEVIKEQE